MPCCKNNFNFLVQSINVAFGPVFMADGMALFGLAKGHQHSVGIDIAAISFHLALCLHRKDEFG